MTVLSTKRTFDTKAIFLRVDPVMTTGMATGANNIFHHAL